MHVEVVGREVQPRGDLGREALGVAKGERGRLDDEHLDGGIVDGFHERDGVVAGGDRVSVRRPQHRRDERGDRGLAIGTRDRDQRSVVPFARQVELAQHRDLSRGRGVEHRMRVGETRTRHKGIDGRKRLREVRARGIVDELHVVQFCCAARVLGGMVVDDDHVVPTTSQGARATDCPVVANP